MSKRVCTDDIVDGVSWTDYQILSKEISRARKQKCDRDPFEWSRRQDAKAPRSPAPPVLSRQRHREELKSMHSPLHDSLSLVLFPFCVMI